MKKITLFFLLLSSFAQSQTILGGGGTCHVNADPNTIVAIAAQNQGACKQAINTVTGELWLYDDTQAASAKWVKQVSTKNLFRTLPTVLNTLVDIGTFNTNANIIFKISICVQPLGVCKDYTITLNGNGIGANFLKIQPNVVSTTTTLDDFELVMRSPTGLNTYLGIVRTKGTNTGDAYISVQQVGLPSIFTSSTTVTAGISYANTFFQYGNSMANIRTYTATFTAAFDDDTIICNSTGFVVGTIPAPTTCLGKQLTLVNIGTGTFVISPAYRINSTTTSGSVAAGNRITVHSNGTEWIQIR